MAVTYRQVLNRVLVALGEDEISSGTSEITSKYHKLLGLFVNQIKEIVEDEHNWRALRSDEQVTVTSGTSSAVITNANERSRIVRVYDDIAGEERALVFDVTDSNSPYRLKEMDMAELLRRRKLDTSNGNDPAYFAIDNTGEDAMSIQVWPTPTDNRTIDIVMVIPQGELGTTDLNTNIKVPARPISVGAAWYAYEERGEELGSRPVFNQEMFNQVLGSSVARDAAEQGDYQLVPG